jgi:preprotein translocase subunit SecF
MTIIDLKGGNVVDVEQYECATGKKKKNLGLWGLIQKSQADQSERRKIRVQSKAEARVGRASAKKGQAVAQQLQAKASKEGVKGDIELAKSLAEKGGEETKTSDNAGLSTTAKYAIGGVSIILVLGIAYMIYTKKKS